MADFQTSHTLAAGETKTFSLPETFSDSLPLSFQYEPVSGGTVSAWVSCSPKKTIEETPNSAVWTPIVTAGASSYIVPIDTPVRGFKVTATTQGANICVTAFHKPSN